MTAVLIDEYSGTLPDLSQQQSAFDANVQTAIVDYTIGYLPAAINAVSENVNANATLASDSAAAAADSEANVEALVPAATAASNYKGLWSSLSGALNMPASVKHNGVFWALNANLANVTTAEPGVSASWDLLPNANTGEGITEVTPNALLGSGAFMNIEQIARHVLAGGLGEGIVAPTGNHTLADTDTALRFGHSATATLTLKANNLKPGRRVLVVNPTSFAINSASANVRDMFGNAAAALILPAGAKGSWALLQDNGTTWDIVAWDLTPVTTTVATTSGTNATLTAPYPNPKSFESTLVEVTYNNTSEMHITLGDAGGLETTNYAYNLVDIRAAGNTPLRNASDNKQIVCENLGSSGNALNGTVVCRLHDEANNTYEIQSNISESAGTTISNGRKSTSAPLTQIDFRPAGATYTGGSITTVWRY